MSSGGAAPPAQPGVEAVTGPLGSTVSGIADAIAVASGKGVGRPPCPPVYASPEEAMKGPVEEIMYVNCINTQGLHDYLAVVDVKVGSPTYCQVIYRLKMKYVGDELHHSGWNACSSCYGKPICRDKLILPCLLSDRIYIIDTAKDPKAPTIYKIIEPPEVHAFNLGTPHTSHCLPGGEIMISTMGKPDGSGQGSFLCLDGNREFEIIGVYSMDTTMWGYDFWYQPYFGVLISTEWGTPSAFKKGFDPADVMKGKYGNSIHVWDYNKRTLIQDIKLGDDGFLPLEIRFMHNPLMPHAFVGCALSSTIFHISKVHPTNVMDKHWKAKKVIAVESLQVQGWALPDMPGILTDILISMDDKMLFFSNWIQGDIRCYDISRPDKPRWVGRAWCGGSIVKGGKVIVTDPKKKEKLKSDIPPKLVVKGRTVDGGPQMLQMSLDGKRLYCTTSLFTPWDKEFYPDLLTKGACMLQFNIQPPAPSGEYPDVNNMAINPGFLVDFGKEPYPYGPALAHEMRYPGGDCSSDVFLNCGTG